MSETNVGANLVFARRTTIVCEPMSEAIVSNSFSNIGLIPAFVRRANTRFAPTLVSDIGWISITTIYPKIYDRLLSALSGLKTSLPFTQSVALGWYVAALSGLRKIKSFWELAILVTLNLFFEHSLEILKK